MIPRGASIMTKKLSVTSPAFCEGEPIPKLYTGEDKDVSPLLQWTDVPEGAKSMALICDDPDAPRGTWVHWVLFNLPPETRQLDQGVPKTEKLANGALQGTNDFPKIGYDGPMPPPGKPHRYYFKVYTLDTMLSLKSGCKKAELEAAMKSHILAEGQLMGTYKR
jgi:Raf kinase inhibitor-like YbhB/YbcL family protein